MIQIKSLHLILSQMLFEQADDGLVRTRVFAPLFACGSPCRDQEEGS
jgi:hypothetical protein